MSSVLDRRTTSDLFEEFQNSEVKKFSYYDFQDSQPFSPSESAVPVGTPAVVSFDNNESQTGSKLQRRLRPNERAHRLVERHFTLFEAPSAPSVSSSVNIESLFCSGVPPTDDSACITRPVQIIAPVQITAVKEEEEEHDHPQKLQLDIISSSCSQQYESVTNGPLDGLQEELDSVKNKSNDDVEDELLFGFHDENAVAGKCDTWKASTENEFSPLVNSPSDLVVLILSFLSARQVAQTVQYVCRGLGLIAQSDALWRIFYERDFSKNCISHQITTDMQQIPWFKLYRRRADKETTDKYSNEPSDVQNLYLEMEGALECLRGDSKQIGALLGKVDNNRTSAKNQKELASSPSDSEVIKSALRTWKESHPNCLALSSEFKRRKSQKELPSKRIKLDSSSHDCVEEKCQFDQPCRGVYICQTSGIYHFCFEQAVCSRAISSDDDTGVFVCPISGKVVIPKPFSDWRTIKRKTNAIGYDVDLASLSEIYNTIIVSNKSQQAKQQEIDELERVKEEIDGPEFRWSEIVEPKTQKREGRLCFAEPEESGAVEDHQEDSWGLPGFFGRCFTEGYECFSEREYHKMKTKRYAGR